MKICGRKFNRWKSMDGSSMDIRQKSDEHVTNVWRKLNKCQTKIERKSDKHWTKVRRKSNECLTKIGQKSTIVMWRMTLWMPRHHKTPVGLTMMANVTLQLATLLDSHGGRHYKHFCFFLLNSFKSLQPPPHIFLCAKDKEKESKKELWNLLQDTSLPVWSHFSNSSNPSVVG